MEQNLVIAIVAALLNIILSLTIPSLFKNSKLPIIRQVRETYENNRHTLIVSSLIVLVFVYVSLRITPSVQQHVFSKFSKLSTPTQLVK
jgi:hypothetical protein